MAFPCHHRQKTIDANQIAAGGEMSAALAPVRALGAVPGLESQSGVRQALEEVAGTENRIATERRRRYNDTVREYDTLVRSFPTMLVARATGFEPQKYFEAPEAAQHLPSVKFE